MTARRHALPLWLFVLLFAIPAFANDPATITRVVDGDTLEITLKGRPEKVRLIGVDTTEKFASDKLHRDAARTGQDEATSRALGKHASDFTKSLVHPEDRGLGKRCGKRNRQRYALG